MNRKDEKVYGYPSGCGCYCCKKDRKNKWLKRMFSKFSRRQAKKILGRLT